MLPRLTRNAISSSFIYSMILIAFSPALSFADVTLRSEIEEEQQGLLSQERLGVKPQLGVINFGVPQEAGTSDDDSERTRPVVGLLVEADLINSSDAMLRNWYVGPSVGIFVSNLDSGALGSVIPLNLKLGYTFGKANFRLSLHGGANAIYRERIGTIELEGSESDPQSMASRWKFFPNFGADVEIGLGEAVAIFLRPDLTITDGEELFMGTIGVTIPLIR